MTCKHCGHKYEANIAATYPGGFGSPGQFFWLTLILALVTVLLFVFSIGFWRWLAFWITIFSSLQIPMAWLACRGTPDRTGGETCPQCQGKNTIFPWSI